MKRILLIDGNALVHRAYHAIPKTFKDHQGNPTNAIFGFAAMFIRAIQQLDPVYVAVAFDSPEPTFRHQEYLEYKEGRPEADAELVAQIPRIQQLIVDFGLPYFELDSYEADDLLAALKIQALQADPELEVIIMTGDMDLTQLVDKSTKVCMPKKGIKDLYMYNEQGVYDRYSIWPSQVVDYKALRGDPSDNIPGVTGIGPKTAVLLLEQFDNLEQIYQNLDKIKPSVVKKLAEGADNAALSQKIAKIVDTAPIKLDLPKAQFGEDSIEQGRGALLKLGFKSLVKRLGGDTGDSGQMGLGL